jgi:hypothetical protein
LASNTWKRQPPVENPVERVQNFRKQGSFGCKETHFAQKAAERFGGAAHRSTRFPVVTRETGRLKMQFSLHGAAEGGGAQRGRNAWWHALKMVRAFQYLTGRLTFNPLIRYRAKGFAFFRRLYSVQG